MKVFVGYDPREDIAFQVCEYSILKHQPEAKVIPLKMDDLMKRGIYKRGPDVLASTQFTLTRYLIPQLMDYKGWALYVDCDTLFLDDVMSVTRHIDDKYAVVVVQHQYTPKTTIKMDGVPQTTYPRKNWSSVVLWNCSHPAHKILNAAMNKQPAHYFHRFEWLRDEQIGSMSVDWNWLVGYYSEPNHGTPRILHYTDGGPWMEKYRRCDYSDVWKEYLFEMIA